MIGVDIEEVGRFKLDRNDAFVKKHFSKEEIDYAFANTLPEQHLCGIFCAKEATFKATGKRIDSVSVSHTSKGNPYILIAGKKQEGLQLSISHCRTHAVAVVYGSD